MHQARVTLVKDTSEPLVSQWQRSQRVPGIITAAAEASWPHALPYICSAHASESMCENQEGSEQ